MKIIFKIHGKVIFQEFKIFLHALCNLVQMKHQELDVFSYKFQNKNKNTASKTVLQHTWLLRIGVASFLTSSMIIPDAAKIPWRSSTGLAPEVTSRIPWLTISWVRSVEVVVPSPALKYNGKEDKRMGRLVSWDHRGCLWHKTFEREYSSLRFALP